MSYQVRHSMSYPSALAPGSPAPAHTPYQIRNSETRNPEPAEPEHGAVEAIYSIPTLSYLTTEHGAVGCAPT
jgi:hypothetical protein